MHSRKGDESSGREDLRYETNGPPVRASYGEGQVKHQLLGQTTIKHGQPQIKITVSTVLSCHFIPLFSSDIQASELDFDV